MGSAICTVWLWYLCSSAISNGFIIPWLFGEFRLFRKMCSPLNQRKSLIHICCSKWLCIYGITAFPAATRGPLLLYPFSSRNRKWWHRQQKGRCCNSASSTLRLHPPGRLGVTAKTPMGKLRRAGGSQAHARRNCRYTTLPQLEGATASQPEGRLKNRYILENHRLSMDNSPMNIWWRMLNKSLKIIGLLRFMPSLKQETGGNIGLSPYVRFQGRGRETCWQDFMFIWWEANWKHT